MAIAPGSLLAHRYRADALLGRGGMGEVWRCHDLEQKHDVAIKFVRAEFLSDPGAARLFHAEVVAVARLNHPGIIPVYDLLRDEQGATLLVMEYRKGSSLGALARLDWPTIRDVLLQILEALAYSHARGVLHLDIKPENVIVERGADPAAKQQLRATLLDFGVARVRRPGRGIERWFDRDAVIGTVEYMAPEQCAGTFERLGPWSDLFSVGAMAFELCAGFRPFPGASDHAGLIRRLQEPPPRLVPGVAGVPPGLDELISVLLALEPRSRPLYAADVLQALRRLDAEFAPPAPHPSEPLIDAERFAPEAITLAFEGATPTTAVLHSAPIDLPALFSQPPSLARSLPMDPALAAVAERTFTADAELPPTGAYGLFGLRDLPLLGRHDERRAVWSAVRGTVLQHRPHVVLLEGPAGVGKSRIARDAMERAVETGLCFAMQTSWSAEGSGDEGLRGLLENLLDTRGRAAPEVRARLDFWLDRIPGQHRAFAREVELLLRPPRDAAPDAGLPLRVAMEALARAAALRPVILWLDDVQWSRGEAEALFIALGERDPPLPVCVIATVRSEEVEDRPSYELFASARATERVVVDRLDLEATRRLVRGLLDVDEELCDLLAARAEGNPLFVTQLLRQLVLAEVVERRDGRYRLARAFDLSSIPADIGALWKRRVEQSGAGRRELAALAFVRDRVSLEVAGELARAIGPALEISIACALSAGLIHIAGGAYVWEHGLLREYLIRTADRVEAPVLHAAAAQALAPLVDREDVQEERAQHLRKAGRIREACEAMLEAGLWSLRRAELVPRRARFQGLLRWAQAAQLQDLEVRALAEIGYMHAEVGEYAKAAETIARARAIVELGGARAAACWVAFRHSQAVRLQGKVEEGARATSEALALARTAGVGEVERLAMVQLGLDLCRRQNDVEARVILEKVAALGREAGDRVGESLALRTLTFISSPAEALGLAERAIDLARSAGALRVELTNRQVRVDLLWRTGAREAARVEARDLAEEAGRRALRQTVSLLELQSAAWAVSESDWADARAHCDAARRWGASAGAVAERFVLMALDIVLALAARDEAAAVAAVEALEGAPGTYEDDTFRDLLRQAERLASGAFAERIRALGSARSRSGS